MRLPAIHALDRKRHQRSPALLLISKITSLLRDVCVLHYQESKSQPAVNARMHIWLAGPCRRAGPCQSTARSTVLLSYGSCRRTGQRQSCTANRQIVLPCKAPPRGTRTAPTRRDAVLHIIMSYCTSSRCDAKRHAMRGAASGHAASTDTMRRTGDPMPPEPSGLSASKAEDSAAKYAPPLRALAGLDIAAAKRACHSGASAAAATCGAPAAIAPRPATSAASCCRAAAPRGVVSALAPAHVAASATAHVSLSSSCARWLRSSSSSSACACDASRAHSRSSCSVRCCTNAASRLAEMASASARQAAMVASLAASLASASATAAWHTESADSS
eukprot:352478-Chlamydomonas_euryale.AAC.2